MALIETLRHLRIVLKDDGSIRSVTGEYDEIDTATGRAAPKGTKRIPAADLAAALPDAAAMIAAVDAAHAERDQLTMQFSELQAAKAAVEASAASAATTAAATISELQSQLSAALGASAQPNSVVDGVPQELTPYQARKALKAAGYLTQVMSMINTLPEDDDVRLAWEWAVVWHRNSDFIAQFADALGLSSAQVDGLFVTGKQVA